MRVSRASATAEKGREISYTISRDTCEISDTMLVRSRVIRGAHFQGNKPIYLYQTSSEMVLGVSR